MQDDRCKMQDAGCKMQDAGYKGKILNVNKIKEQKRKG